MSIAVGSVSSVPCYHPNLAIRANKPNKNGKLPLVFLKNAASLPRPLPPHVIPVPCGRCIGCRLGHSQAWAIRCVHEASLHPHNAFITLTFSNEYIPASGSLYKSDFQRFLKRFRKRISPHKIRYYHCGEYGAKLGRPHHHACIFGYQFPDLQPYLQRGDTTLYRSPTLEKLWPYGFSSVGELTYQSAAYVARYILKKITGEPANKHYQAVDLTTGEIVRRLSEYTSMSLKPGIGADWYKLHHKDVFPSDFVTHKGKKLHPPNYYTSLYQRDHPEEHAQLIEARIAAAKLNQHDSTPARLKVRETVTQAKLTQLKRPLQ